MDQFTITEEIVRILLDTGNYREVINLTNTNNLIHKWALPIIRQSYNNSLKTPPTLENTTKIDENGFVVAEIAKEWHHCGKRHREWDLPAIIHRDGMLRWYKNGKRHRDYDLPAIVKADGSFRWFKNGLLHRDGGLPAVMYVNGSKEWYKEGRLYRDGNLPAFICVGDGVQKMGSSNLNQLSLLL